MLVVALFDHWQEQEGPFRAFFVAVFQQLENATV